LSGAPPVLPDRTVLVVDDEEHVRNALSRVLSDAGYSVSTAESGEEALEALGQKPVKLIHRRNIYL